jgi:L-gulonolactone oxidase
MGEWRNWAGDQVCSPAVVERPSTLEEIAAAVVAAGARPHAVRTAGSGHSFGDIVLTEGTLISLERRRRVLDVDRASGLVRVEAGITLAELNRALWNHGLALENLGDIDAQTIAGATATATHGTGGRLPNLSAALHSIELVLADGSVTEVSEQSDPDAWRAARVGLGALGVVSAVTLQAVPAFTLEGVDATAPLDETLDRLDELDAANDHFELYSFPHSDLALTRTNNRVEAQPDPPSAARDWLEQIALRNHVFELVCRAGARAPRLIPPLNRAVARATGTSRRVDRSYRVFASPRRVRFTEMEYALPREHAAAALREVRAAIVERRYAVPFPLELRLVASDDALLSPASGRDTAYVAVHMYRGMDWAPFMRRVEEIMRGFEGRPHWGKRHFQTAATLAPLYPDWERFAAVRARLDPHGCFSNGHVQRVLGPIGAAASHQ